MSIDAATLPTAELRLAVALAQRAAVAIRDQAGRIERLTKRGGEEAVTAADRACQRLIVAGLREAFPEDGLIGEESDSGEGITCEAPKRGTRSWVIDPIDGTNNFIAGLGCYAVCIGLVEDGQPVAGVVHDVARDEVWYAHRGHGAFRDRRRIACAIGPLSDSALVMLTSNLIVPGGGLPSWLIPFFRDQPFKLRILGSAALEAVSVADGTAHAAVTLNGKLWDIAAPAAIVAEAGGRLLRPDGSPLCPFRMAGYAGEKVPFVVTAPNADLLAHMR